MYNYLGYIIQETPFYLNEKEDFFDCKRWIDGENDNPHLGNFENLLTQNNSKERQNFFGLTTFSFETKKKIVPFLESSRQQILFFPKQPVLFHLDEFNSLMFWTHSSYKFNSSSHIDSDYSNVWFFIYRTKKLFEFPVERDFANEKAFTAAQYPFLFQIFLRMRFFEIEVRFFGTAIQKLRGFSLLSLDVKDM